MGPLIVPSGMISIKILPTGPSTDGYMSDSIVEAYHSTMVRH